MTAIKWLERYRREGLRRTGGTRRPSSFGLDAASGVPRGRARREVGPHASKAVRPASLREGRQGRHLDDEPVLPPDRRHAQKKTLVAREQDRADIRRHRTRWRTYQSRIDPPASSLSTRPGPKPNMTRLYGWAPGERLIDKVPHSHWETATFLAALRSDRIDAPCLFDGPINGERFRAYVEQFLVPTLKAGDVVILDNLRFAQRQGRAEAIRDVGAPLVFCRNTPTSTRSNSSSPSSKPCCEKSEREPTRPLAACGEILKRFPASECAATSETRLCVNQSKSQPIGFESPD